MDKPITNPDNAKCDVTRETIQDHELKIIGAIRYGVMMDAKRGYEESFSAGLPYPVFAVEGGLGVTVGSVFGDFEHDLLEQAKEVMQYDSIWAIYGRRTPKSEPEFVVSWEVE